MKRKKKDQPQYRFGEWVQMLAEYIVKKSSLERKLVRHDLVRKMTAKEQYAAEMFDKEIKNEGKLVLGQIVGLTFKREGFWTPVQNEDDWTDGGGYFTFTGPPLKLWLIRTSMMGKERFAMQGDLRRLKPHEIPKYMGLRGIGPQP